MAYTVMLMMGFLSVVVMQCSAEETEKGSCYRIAPGTLAGAVLGDIALTIFIVGVTYCCASKRRQKKENAEKVYMNVRANCKP
ncbi:hematopoietic cell signal transducer [Astyanax mexicanus]|uniref:Hematopoietic cell signal transducer n=2 Tax=Astyanax mexicanus TaxID=7994 RepID=A0A8B9JTS1_ASTMX|nr:hematopoietic cell signal transducer [Astyanax mexicanus]XP_049336690.1 hematopoietic cell signal transducer [Astyanax mexicanus]